MTYRFKDAFLTALIAAILALPLAGARTIDGSDGLTVEWHLVDVAVAAVLIFFGRLALSFIQTGQGRWIAPVAVIAGIVSVYLPFPSHFLQTVAVAGCFIIAARAVYHFIRHPGESRDQDALSMQTDRSLGIDQKARTDGLGFDVKKSWIPAFVGMTQFVKRSSKNLNAISLALIGMAIILPFTPLASRYVLDVAVMVMTYIMLAWGLNITVGYTGLLDLGYAGFYALGAYCYALLAQNYGIGFWTALPLSGLIAASAAFLLGLPVLRLRGDYFAIVTLGFGEIVRLVLINWTSLTGGPNGISGVPRPFLFNLEFARSASEGHRTFNEFFGIDYDPLQRVVYLYYIILALALLVGFLSARLRRLPLGRAWEAFREDEIACASLGISRWGIKVAAYSLGATVAGLAGAFFATRQGFISPESFTFTESATMLAIVILGGIGHPLGIVLAAIFIIGMPELFRELEQYRMLAFGAGMVLIMIWRPGGMMATREITVRMPPEKSAEKR